MIPYGRQWVDEDDIQSVLEVLRSDWLTQGPLVDQFEDALASYCNARYCVVFSSGTAALHAAYQSAGLQAGERFITSPITFSATANAGRILGAEPDFHDVDPDTGNLDPEQLPDPPKPGTRLLVPVHYAGNPCSMKSLKSWADRHGVVIVEDAAHALGAETDDHRVGSCKYSLMTVFSFHPVKTITSGEGGAVTTNCPVTAERLRMFRSHGITKDVERFVEPSPGDWYSEMQFLGMNYRLPDLCCALGLSQLRRIEQFVSRRQELAGTYRKILNHSAIATIQPADQVAPAWHLFPLFLPVQDMGEKKLAWSWFHQQGLGVQVHYRPVYQHPYYRQSGFRDFSLPHAERLYRQEFSLPIFPAMNQEQETRVTDVLLQLVEQPDCWKETA